MTFLHWLRPLRGDPTVSRKERLPRRKGRQPRQSGALRVEYLATRTLFSGSHGDPELLTASLSAEAHGASHQNEPAVLDQGSSDQGTVPDHHGSEISAGQGSASGTSPDGPRLTDSHGSQNGMTGEPSSPGGLSDANGNGGQSGLVFLSGPGYPLAPGNGPALRGDIVTQSPEGSLPVALPASTVAVVPLLLAGTDFGNGQRTTSAAVPLTTPPSTAVGGPPTAPGSSDFGSTGAALPVIPVTAVPTASGSNPAPVPEKPDVISGSPLIPTSPVAVSIPGATASPGSTSIAVTSSPPAPVPAVVAQVTLPSPANERSNPAGVSSAPGIEPQTMEFRAVRLVTPPTVAFPAGSAPSSGGTVTATPPVAPGNIAEKGSLTGDGAENLGALPVAVKPLIGSEARLSPAERAAQAPHLGAELRLLVAPGKTGDRGSLTSVDNPGGAAIGVAAPSDPQMLGAHAAGASGAPATSADSQVVWSESLVRSLVEDEDHLNPRSATSELDGLFAEQFMNVNGLTLGSAGRVTPPLADAGAAGSGNRASLGSVRATPAAREEVQGARTSEWTAFILSLVLASSASGALMTSGRSGSDKTDKRIVGVGSNEP